MVRMIKFNQDNDLSVIGTGLDPHTKEVLTTSLSVPKGVGLGIGFELGGVLL